VIVTCEQCTAQFHLDDAKVPEEGIRVRCSRCKHAFLVESPNRSDLDRAEDLARDALDSAPEDEIESDWQFNEEVPPEQAAATGRDGRDVAEAAVDDLLGASFGRSLASPADREASLGDSPASLDGLEAGSGDSLASPGGLHASSGDSLASPGGLEANSGDSLASPGGLDSSSGDLLAAAGAPEASFSDTDTSLDGLDAAVGEPGDVVGDLELDFDFDELTPDPALDPGSDFDSQPVEPGKAELEMARAEPTVDAGVFEDPADTHDLSGDASPAESGATDDLHTAAAPGPAAEDASLERASDVIVVAEPAASSPNASPDLRDPEERDEEPVLDGAPSLRTEESAIDHAPSSTAPESARSSLSRSPAKQAIDASALEADLEGSPGNARISRAGTGLGWSVVCALCAYAAFAGLAPRAPALPTGGISWSIAGLDGHEIRGRWIENAAAGPIYVVSGNLRVGASGSSEPGALLRLRLVDHVGRPIAAQSAALGAPVHSARLREWNLRDLRSEQEKSARRLARTPVQPGELRPFLAILGGVPPTAKGYEITRGD